MTKTTQPLISYQRAARARLDEVRLVAKHVLHGRRGRGSVMIDVGAHYGSALAPFARTDWTVHAFEPDPSNRGRLEQRWGDHDNVRIDPRAVSNEARSRVPFYTSAESTGISSLSAFHSSHERAGEVDATTLASYCREHGIEHIDLLKVDAEGHDLFVLQGLDWDALAPQVVICEFEDSKTRPLGYTFTDLADYLVERGYTIYVSEWYPVRRYGVRHDWHKLERYPCELGSADAWGNLIAVRAHPPGDSTMRRGVRELVEFAHRPNPGKKDPATTSFVYQPAFDDPSDLHDQLARAAFYLSSVELGHVYFLVHGTPPERFELPDELAPEIAGMVADLWPKLRFVDADDAEASAAALATSKVVMRWRESDDDAETLPGKQIRVVDKRSRRLEGSIYVEAAYRSQPDLRHITERNKRAFERLARRLGRRDKAYVFGTGPSASRYGEFSFDDGVSIVCNTIIKDEQLMDWVQPDILVFADPIFHFGCSRYASEFRQLVCRAAETYDLAIVVPVRYFAHLTWLCPELEPRIVGIPFNKTRDVVTDLTSWFAVPPIDNILTLLLLPLAATFADEIYIIGCDGRDPSDEGTFWKHNAKTQLGGLMQNIRDAHPGFFKLSYEEYYQRHCDNLEHWLSVAEQRGFLAQSLVESKIPALRRRKRPNAEPLADMLRTDRPYRVVSINPDSRGLLGHFGPHDARVREQVEADGGDFVALAGRFNVDADAGERVFPLFTDDSRSALTVGRRVRERFEHELGEACRVIEAADPNTPNIFMMYVGSVQHIVPVLRAAGRLRPEHNVVVMNLFWTQNGIYDPVDPVVVAELVHTLQHTRSLRQRHRVHVAADTPTQAAAVEALTGERLLEWPMFGVTRFDAPRREPAGGGAVRVLCPSTMQYAKGYDLMARVVDSLADDERIQFVVRDASHADVPEALRPVVESLGDKAEVLRGYLTAEQYAEEFGRADVIVIPYRKHVFYGRTSGVLVDAVAAGCAVVATRDTWAGRRVEALGIGATFRDGDIDDLRRAVLEVVEAVDRLKARVHQVQSAFAEHNSPAAFLRFLRALPSAGPSDDGAADLEGQLLDLVADLVRHEVELVSAPPVASAQAPPPADPKPVEPAEEKSTETAPGADDARRTAPEDEPEAAPRDTPANGAGPVPALSRMSRKLRKLVRDPRKFVVDAARKRRGDKTSPNG